MCFLPSIPSNFSTHKPHCTRTQAGAATRTMARIQNQNRRGAFFSLWVRNGEDTAVLLCRCPLFFSSFIQSCKAAVWCHQSQSACTSCAALIGCNDLRMSLHTLICFSLWPICFPILPRAAGRGVYGGHTHRRDPPTLRSLLRRLAMLCSPLPCSPSLLCAYCFCNECKEKDLKKKQTPKHFNFITFCFECSKSTIKSGTVADEQRIKTFTIQSSYLIIIWAQYLYF